MLGFTLSAALHATLLVAFGALTRGPELVSLAEVDKSHMLVVDLIPAAKSIESAVPSASAPTPLRSGPLRAASAKHARALPAPRMQAPAAETRAATEAVAVKGGISAPGTMSAPLQEAVSASLAPHITAFGGVADTPASSGDALPGYLDTPEPEYPQAAREDEQEGTVVLRVLVSQAGHVARIDVTKSSGFRLLDAAALSAVRRWTFRPAKRGQLDVEAWMDVPIRFRLR